MGDLQEKINVLERDLQSEMDARASADQTAADLMAIVATLQEDLAYARNELKKIPKGWLALSYLIPSPKPRACRQNRDIGQ